MNCFYIFHIAAFSIWIPFTVSLTRFKRLNRKYLPLSILLAAGIANDMISYINIRHHSTNMINSNVYVLVEFFLILWLASRWTNGIPKKLLISVAVFGLVTWITDDLVLHSLHSNNSGFRLAASLGIAWVSIEKLTDFVFYSQRVPAKNTDLLLSIGFLFFFTFKGFVESFHLVPIPLSKEFYKSLWALLAVFDTITNLLITVAILCVPPLQKFSIRSSQD